MNAHTEKALTEAMRAEGIEEQKITAVLARLASMPSSSTVSVTQTMGTVEAGATVVGYRADRIG